jgi:hypothetical protein
MNKPQTNGWGAYQNKKTEIDKLKRQLVVQDVNNYGEVMTIDKKYNFKPVYTTVNSFRFSNLIKNEEICEIYKKPDDKIEIPISISIPIPIVEDNVKLTITDISEPQPNVDLNTCDKIQEFDEISNYKKKLFNNTLIINGLIEENQKNKLELEDKIKLLTETYNNQVVLNNNKIVKLQKYNDALQNMIELKLNLLEIENDITLQDNNIILQSKVEEEITITNLDDDESESEESEEDDSDSDDKSTSVVETVPDEFSIINIMKKTYEKQKLEEEQQKQTATIIKDYDNTIITVDDVNYMFIREHWYKHTQYQYRAYKLDNGRNNKIRSNSNNKRKCCHRNCNKHLGWVTINEERQYSCHNCDKLIINHDSIIKYNNKIYLPKDIPCLNNPSLHDTSSRKWEIEHDLHVYLLKKDERIIINNEISLEICWFYNGEKYMYKEAYDKQATKYKTVPVIIYNDATLVCETDVKYYKVKINGIYMNFLRDV